MSSNLNGYLWCGLAAVASALATLLIKLSAHAGVGWTLARMGWLGGACTTYALGFVCYSIALQKLQISLAYPVMTAATMCLVALIGATLLNEPLHAGKLAGMALIAAGAFILTR
ncbi:MULTISPECIES: SMR family transporter [unclassified Janthinobacterium]|uniref:DMT family transporter n=1 Tax=unclassified Janthinobacterium TaxID=2610881 RepID=UPI000C700CA1|nr:MULTISPECIES: SMR family transporter [unclassified Janthinobacterium]PKV45699.1 multidrug transporter EmrE-like cation transporter [Janthinobacterium sp. 61]TDY34047.1 multidrug transporter EmrE-like cation transporter [Janthinobacterium sp. 75]